MFDTNILISLLIGIILSGSYLIKGGFRSNIYADAFQFFVMFIGFILIFIVCLISFGGIDFLTAKSSFSHLKITG